MLTKMQIRCRESVEEGVRETCVCVGSADSV